MVGIKGMPRRSGMMLGFPTIACAAALLVAGCMSGPIPVSSRAGDNGANATGPSEEKLPGAPAVRSSPP